MNKLRNGALALALAFGLSAPPAMATDYGTGTPAPQGSQGVGLMISTIAGSGLTYQHVFPNGWGFHVSGIGWGQGASFFYNFGGAVTKTFIEREWGNVYGLAAVGYGLNLFSGLSRGTGSATIESNFAPGIGVNWGILTAELGYSFYNNSGGPGLQPAGGAGLMFRF